MHVLPQLEMFVLNRVWFQETVVFRILRLLFPGCEALCTQGTQEEAAEAYGIAAIKCPTTPPTSNPTTDYQTVESEHVLKRSRPFGITYEANNLPVNMLPVAYPNQSHGQSSYSSDDLPRSVVMTLCPGSTVKSMDFHPVQQIFFLLEQTWAMLW